MNCTMTATIVQIGVQAFDVCIEASGSSGGIKTAMAITRAMGTIVLKSTCSTINDPNRPQWSALANDIVVNEKQLIGSRYPLIQCMVFRVGSRLQPSLNTWVLGGPTCGRLLGCWASMKAVDGR